jgi:hypothetical protein
MHKFPNRLWPAEDYAEIQNVAALVPAIPWCAALQKRPMIWIRAERWR